MRRPFAWIRRPVRREGAERYVFITLVSFAAAVIGTRWFVVELPTDTPAAVAE